MTMKDVLNRMLNHEELTREEMKEILVGITKSEFPQEQITALLTGLQMRGVTVDELLGFRDGILETGVPAHWIATAISTLSVLVATVRTRSTSPPRHALSLPVPVTK